MRGPELALGTVIALVLTVGACSAEREPKDYDDCILKYVKAGMDRAAVLALQRSCRAKFPADRGHSNDEGTSRGRELTPVELAALDGRAGPASFGNNFSGQLYNGNSGLKITSVRVRMTTRIGGKEDSRTYEETVSIPPRAAGSISFSIIVGDQGARYDWSIEGATGVPAK